MCSHKGSLSPSKCRPVLIHNLAITWLWNILMVDFIGADPNIFSERMLEAGYFPENLPPVFRIENLHEASLGPLATAEYLISKSATEPARFDATKRNGQRRTFSMPNPLFMVDCAKYFIARADEIDEHLSLSTDSCSIPVFSEVASRPQKIDSFGDFYGKRRKEFASSKYIIKTDISRFFHSIYTHCLPWALHGKAASKADRKIESETIFGNRLDFIVRQSQDGQTIGIPVGPDFSRLISEIIGVRIDLNFRERVGPEVPMLRLVDDIYIGSDNLDEAYAVLGTIRDAIRLLELDTNDSKTVVIEASKDVEPFWPVEIRRSLERYKEYAKADVSDFVHTLDEVLSVSNLRSDEAIIKYALRKIDDLKIWQFHWNSLEPFLIRCCISFPHSWDYVAQMVAWRHLNDGVDVALWRRAIEKSLIQHVRSGHDFEVVWALWLARQLEIPLAKALFSEIFDRCGPFSMLLALDVHKVAKMEEKLPIDKILEKVGDKPLLGPNWVFSFEADRQFGLKLKTKNLQGHEFFKQLYDNNVSFYDADFDLEKDQDIKGGTANAIKKTSSYDDLSEPEEPDDDDF